MELRKLKLTEEPCGAICDMCQNSCLVDEEHDCYEFGVLEANWGFFSDDGKDTEHEECHLCQLCFNKVRDFIKAQGGNVRVKSHLAKSPKNGEDWQSIPGLDATLVYRDKLYEQIDQIKADIEKHMRKEWEVEGEITKALIEKEMEGNHD